MAYLTGNPAFFLEFEVLKALLLHLTAHFLLFAPICKDRKNCKIKVNVANRQGKMKVRKAKRVSSGKKTIGGSERQVGREI